MSQQVCNKHPRKPVNGCHVCYVLNLELINAELLAALEKIKKNAAGTRSTEINVIRYQFAGIYEIARAAIKRAKEE